MSSLARVLVMSSAAEISGGSYRLYGSGFAQLRASGSVLAISVWFHSIVDSWRLEWSKGVLRKRGDEPVLGESQGDESERD